MDGFSTYFQLTLLDCNSNSSGNSSDNMTTTDNLELLYPLGVTSQNVYLPITNSCYFCYPCEYLLSFRDLLDSWPFVRRYFLACFSSLELWECIYIFLSLMSVYVQFLIPAVQNRSEVISLPQNAVLTLLLTSFVTDIFHTNSVELLCSVNIY